MPIPYPFLFFFYPRASYLVCVFSVLAKFQKLSSLFGRVCFVFSLFCLMFVPVVVLILCLHVNVYVVKTKNSKLARG